MSGNISLAIMPAADDDYRVSAQYRRPDEPAFGAIAAVDLTNLAHDRVAIHSSEPGALRKLAAALIAAEDEADLMRAAAEVTS